MPDPYERHSRNSWEWGPSPARGQTRAAAADQQLAPEVVPEGKRPPGKKDPKLCKAAHWKGPHTPELRVRQYGWRKGAKCGWDVSWGGEKPAYFCQHEAFCTGCGKVTSTSIGFSDCPDSSPLTDERRMQIELNIEQRRERLAKSYARRHPPIDGPQGYRKEKRV